MTAGPAPCPDALCPDGACDSAEFGALLGDKVMWLWKQFADRADRAMEHGTVTITAPSDAAQRAAVLGLLGTRSLRPGQSKRINLPELTRRLRARGPRLTPAAVAAHALRRALGQNAAEHARQAARLAGLQELATDCWPHFLSPPR
ncbi:TIGR02679 domain-containing protein [Streptomyces sp. NBC_00873]|uniref:TIGR02679 domain-containing protein n=1 Tax=unclassified Streptomyces TaxID=2593676 RepID=UPI003866F0C0|nr:TIGR02679 domain-containing protein [Streptomyces sp. NBC_00873]WTA42049.1 TIGR02679 domain-containing protein [Streptomyces sp. NBC_00842]